MHLNVMVVVGIYCEIRCADNPIPGSLALPKIHMMMSLFYDKVMLKLKSIKGEHLCSYILLTMTF